MKLLGFVLVGLSLVGCASTPSRVEKSLGNQEAIVTLGSTGMKQGDSVEILKDRCIEVVRRGVPSQSCRKVPIGQAKVIELISAQEIRIKADEGVNLEPGFHVQKVSQDFDMRRFPSDRGVRR